ncbi:MAG: hypothetical protein M1830_010071 [Pleopsidium flavum]|nr:MAG: hypothetical protein M1830_010071 [Pleopsidium flavum]
MERNSAPAKQLWHRSQLDAPNLDPPSRATTAPTSDKTRHHFHHHPHRHHHHRDKSIPQSAIQLRPPGGLFADLAPSKVLSRSNGGTPAASAAGSRRESLAAGKEDLKKVSRQKDVDRAKEERRARNEELRTSLQSLSTLSTTATRRLDITYYNLLQTLGTIVTTISSLQELSSSTTRLQQDFQSEADELEQDIVGQIEGFHNFEAQQTWIEGLEGLMRQKRKKVEELGRRLEGVRKRVEDWETRESQWQAKTSRRLRVLWSGIGVLVLLFVALLIFQHLPVRHGEHAAQWSQLYNSTLSIKGLHTPKDTNDSKFSNVAALDTASHPDAGRTPGSSSGQAEEPQLDPDPRIRAFDEL